MSRSQYVDDCYGPEMDLYRANVERSIKGRRGQAFLREMAAALDAMPEKALITDELVTEEGDCCALGAVALAKGIDVSKVDPECPGEVARVFGIARCLAAEIEYENDEYEGSWRWSETPQQRWIRMRKWVAKQLGENK